MATYLLLALGSTAAEIDTAVESKISEGDRHRIESGKWLISSARPTSKDVSDSLGLTGAVVHFIAPLRGYFGLATPDVWEWLAAKSAPVNA